MMQSGNGLNLQSIDAIFTLFMFIGSFVDFSLVFVNNRTSLTFTSPTLLKVVKVLNFRQGKYKLTPLSVKRGSRTTQSFYHRFLRILDVENQHTKIQKPV